MKFKNTISKKRAENLMRKVSESANGEFVGRCYRYNVIPVYDAGFYFGVALTRCDMDGRHQITIYTVPSPDLPEED